MGLIPIIETTARHLKDEQSKGYWTYMHDLTLDILSKLKVNEKPPLWSG